MNVINVVLHNPMALVLMAFVTGIASIRVPSYLKGRIGLRRLWYARGNMEGHTGVVIPRLLSPLRANLGKMVHVAYRMLSLYLLVTIGFRGGYEVSVNGLESVLLPGGAAILLSFLITLNSTWLLRKLRFSSETAVAIATHYGSVSVGTFAVAVAFLNSTAVSYSPTTSALLALMEAPAILTGLVLLSLSRAEVQHSSGRWEALRVSLRDMFFSESMVGLLGALVVGYFLGPKLGSLAEVLLVAPFEALLSIFLFFMGRKTGKQLSALKEVGIRLVGFGLVAPIVNGTLGVGLATLVGLDVGSATLFGTLAASASYIAATATMKRAAPSVKEAFYLTPSLAVTFLFNTLIGIRLYFGLAQLLS